MPTDKANLEQALNEDRVTIVGERGKQSVSPEFLRRLDDLSPSFRRLALARACVLPWTDRPEELPACYQWELTRATAEASEDRAAYPHMDGLLDDLFADVAEPLNSVQLSQLVEMTPTGRYFHIIFALALASKPGGVKAVLAGSRDAPKWLHHEFAYAQQVRSDEYRALSAAG